MKLAQATEAALRNYGGNCGKLVGLHPVLQSSIANESWPKVSAEYEAEEVGQLIASYPGNQT